MLDKQQLKQLSTWAGFVGIINLIGGIIGCITIVGIVTGIIAIILGLKLRSAKRFADDIVASADESTYVSKVNLLMSDLSVYFKIQGILIIIGLAFAVIGIIIAVSLGLFAASQFGGYNYFY